MTARDPSVSSHTQHSLLTTTCEGRMLAPILQMTKQRRREVKVTETGEWLSQDLDPVGGLCLFPAHSRRVRFPAQSLCALIRCRAGDSLPPRCLPSAQSHSLEGPLDKRVRTPFYQLFPSLTHEAATADHRERQAWAWIGHCFGDLARFQAGPRHLAFTAFSYPLPFPLDTGCLPHLQAVK